MSVRPTLLMILAGLALIAAAAAARAAEMDTSQVQISMRGLAIDTASGEAAVRARVTRAAEAVCGWNVSRDQPGAADVKACRKAAIAAAMSQVDVAVASARARARGTMMASANGR